MQRIQGELRAEQKKHKELTLKRVVKLEADN